MNQSKDEETCEHNWEVRDRKEKYVFLDGDLKSGYTVYFCTKCLETKTKVDE